jgi:hypothetical protein
VLLSFAQFEREVVGERVRDKIAASKRKGIWVGGAGSARLSLHRQETSRCPRGRRHCPQHLQSLSRAWLDGGPIEDLDRRGIRTKERRLAGGPIIGGIPSAQEPVLPWRGGVPGRGAGSMSRSSTEIRSMPDAALAHAQLSSAMTSALNAAVIGLGSWARTLIDSVHGKSAKPIIMKTQPAMQAAHFPAAHSGALARAASARSRSTSARTLHSPPAGGSQASQATAITRVASVSKSL